MSTDAQPDLPKGVIKRIVKEKLSAAAAGSDAAKADVQLHKDALLAFAESTKVFISYVTATANDICKEKKRATLSADDVFQALEDLEFQDMMPELKEAFEAYKQSTNEKKKRKAEGTRKRKSANQATTPDTAAAADTGAAAANGQPDVAAPVEKKPHTDANGADAAADADQGGNGANETAADKQQAEATTADC